MFVEYNEDDRKIQEIIKIPKVHVDLDFNFNDFSILKQVLESSLSRPFRPLDTWAPLAPFGHLAHFETLSL